MTGDDADFSSRDLLETIRRGEFPRWKMFIQVMQERDADTYKWHPFDLTKIWPHGDYPLIEVGEMTLGRNVENYFAEIEQAAFEPSSTIPGIGFSPDKMLQNRVLSYGDAHRYRLGINYDEVPVNQAKSATVRDYHRGGVLRADGNGGGAVDYEPNSFGGPAKDRSVTEPPLRVDGNASRHEFKRDDEDFCAQPHKFWEKALDEGGRARLVENIVGSMTNPSMGIDNPRPIQERMLRHWYEVHPDFGAAVAKGLGIGAQSRAAE